MDWCTKVALSIVAFIVILLGIALFDVVTGNSCKQTWSSYEVSYSVFGGCKALYDGKMVPAGSIRHGGIN